MGKWPPEKIVKVLHIHWLYHSVVGMQME